jgi:hypothetical protein
MNQHREDQVLDYHGYLDLKKTLRTDLGKNLKAFAEKIGLRVAGIYAFTARAGSVTSVHVDGDDINGPLPWRLAYYVEGQPGIISWHTSDSNKFFSEHVKAYVFPNDLPIEYSQKMDMHSAFVRTEIPHKLDISDTSVDRLTVTATFLPRISWEELNSRLDKLEHDQR